MNNKKMVLIDGNSLLHRAFYALPPLTNKDGIFTNGVYGFLTMLYKILDEQDPDYISVAFDRKVPTFRHKQYKNYKAGRKKTPSELGTQFPILKDILDRLNIHSIGMDGYEADDIIGTLANMGSKQGLDVILVTGDKDYLQLIDKNIKVFITRRGITNLEEYDKEKMMEKYSLTPSQFVDLKGLMGDKSDNIPGIPRVGEKTGIKLLKKFETMEGIYERIDEVSGKKLKERLIEYKQQAFMSKELGKIVTNVPLNDKLIDLKRKKPDYDRLYDKYKELDFNSLLSRLDGKVEKQEKKYLKIEPVIINKIDELDSIINDAQEKMKICFKFILDGTDPMKDSVLGLGLKVENRPSVYIDFMNEENINAEGVLEKLKIIFQDKSIKKLGHNVKKDIITLYKYDVKIENIVFDSFVAQYLIHPSDSNYKLESIVKEYLDINITTIKDLTNNKSTIDVKELSIENRAKFICSKVSSVLLLEPKISKKIDEYDMNSLYNYVELPLVEVLASMEYIGFNVDEDILNELKVEFNSKIENLTDKIYNLAGEEFNINSPKQLSVILFDKLDLPPIKKTKTGYSTSADVLEKLKDKHEIIEKILEYRKIIKLKTTYIDGLIALIDNKTNRIHSSFNQAITTTGRISSTKPNLQNIPIKTTEGRRIRKVFVPKDEEYILVDADYSQIELRVLAHISNDKKLKEAFYSNEDIHTKTASEVFDVSKEDVTSLMRSRAKAVNFGIIYGISDYGLSRDLNITRKEARKYIDNYLSNYKSVKKYMEDIVTEGKKKGYVTTILNRRRYLDELKSRNYNVRSFGERMAMNTPIQGSAADIIKIAMVSVYNELKRRKMKSRLILQVHDELIIEAYKDEIDEVQDILKNLMENAVELKVPLKVDMKTGGSWYETK